MDSVESKIDKALHCLKLAQNSDYIGESISQLEHALQGAYFAEQAGHCPEVILASLFHDIGHFASNTEQFNMADLGVVNHEWIGAKLAYDFGFSAKVALLIGYHVDAKRYLAGKKPSYFVRLSEASRGTLNFQGGAMSDTERLLFEKHRYFKEILQVRINDEKAKRIDLRVPDLDYYRPYIQEHFNKQSQRNESYIKLGNYIDALWVADFKAHLEKSY